MAKNNVVLAIVGLGVVVGIITLGSQKPEIPSAPAITPTQTHPDSNQISSTTNENERESTKSNDFFITSDGRFVLLKEIDSTELSTVPSELREAYVYANGTFLDRKVTMRTGTLVKYSIIMNINNDLAPRVHSVVTDFVANCDHQTVNVGKIRSYSDFFGSGSLVSFSNDYSTGSQFESWGVRDHPKIVCRLTE